ncbi:MAG TPA: preprotein translocase subunit SecE [Solirubrobacteraceae bacterium]
MARNRKRAKERRARRPTPAPAARPGVATRAQPQPERADAERTEPEREELPRPVPDEELPSPLEHAAPDAELVDAQIALGRAEADTETGGALADEDLEDDGGGLDGDGLDGAPPDGADGGGGELAPVGPGGSAPAERRRLPGNRLINFLQGSWRELQRVQWPDRRQVMQATGVVIGFVIVAGVFLGVADALAGKVVNFILK